VEAVTKRPLANILLIYETDEKIIESLGRTDEWGRFMSPKPLPAGLGRLLTGALPSWDGVGEAELLRIDLGNDPHENIGVVYAHAGVIKGIVLGTEGEPAADRVVRLRVQGLHATPYEPSYRSATTCRTSPDGRFRFEHLPMEAEFRVTADLGMEVASALEVRAEVAHLARDLILGPDRNTVIGGILRYRDGRPGVGVRVHTERARKLASGFVASLGFHPTVVTDASGRFEIVGLQPGTYMISAAASRHYWGGEPIEVLRGRRMDVELVEHCLLHISGSVEPDSDAPPSGGRVCARLRVPLGELGLGLIPPGWDLPWTGFETKVGDDGTFRIADLPPGIYEAQALGPPPRDVGFVTPLQRLRRINASGDPLRVKAGTSGVRLNWKRRVNQILLLVQVSETGTGHALADGRLQFVPGEVRLYRLEGLSWNARVEPGRHLVAASFPRHAPLLIPVDVPAGGSEVHQVSVKTRRGRRIVGTIQTADEQPVARALVTVLIETSENGSTFGGFGTSTGRNGRFNLENAPAHGGYLKVVAPFRKPWVVPITSARPVITLPAGH
jgi:hypothetical protein